MRRRDLLLTLGGLWVTGIGTSAGGRLSAQESQKNALYRALLELNDSAPEAELAPLNLSNSRSVVWLLGATRAWEPRSPDEGRGLRESIERMTRALRSVPQEGRVALLRSIFDDLEDKVAVCRLQGLGARLQVRVVTKRNGVVEVKGFEVLYLEKFLENDPTATPQQFRGFSSPAVDDLVAGRYVFWAKEPGTAGRSGARKDGRVAVGSPQGPIEVLTP